MRAPPRAAAGLRAASRPPPPAALERAGCSLTASGRRGRGVKSAPPPRPHLLGASPFEPAGETSAAWGGGPTLSVEGAEAPVLTPHTHFCLPGGLGDSAVSSSPGCSTPRGRGSTATRPRLRPRGSLRAPPPRSGRAWAGPVLPSLAKVRVGNWAVENNDCHLYSNSEFERVNPPSSPLPSDQKCPSSGICPSSGRCGLTEQPKSRVVLVPASSTFHPAYTSRMFV